ncbi:MAG: prolipoprotein diacylglyceryl transferase [Acidimicrobiia bacterium]|nr:prolipoprotein diacylglyceryl transferase [Acidimicrobiia bacterium]
MTLMSIPSPGSDSLNIGSLELRAYGLMIALGVLAAAWLFHRRFVQRGHSPELAGSITVWAVIAGLIGSRIYHVITDWKTYQGNWGEVWQIWEGGLGITGGVVAAAAVIWVYARQKGIPMSKIADSAAPALPLGQAIGRWGNWFNQELYGRPTDLPWALEIDPENRRFQYLNDETFHPTFLYECIWNLALVGALLWAGKRFTLKPGRLFGLYVLGYSLGRLWIEFIRVDYASELAGVRVNIWVMLALILGSAAYLLYGRGGDSDEESEEEAPEDPSSDELTPESDEPTPDADEPVSDEPVAKNVSLET